MDRLREAIDVDGSVANHLNIDTKDYSIGYLNSWSFDKISDEQLENVMKNVQATAKELIEKLILN